MEHRINALCDFLNASRSSYHAVAYLENLLQQKGYKVIKGVGVDMFPHTNNCESVVMLQRQR